MLLLPSPRLGSRVLRCEPRCRSVAASSLRGGAEASGSDLLERPSKIMSRRGLASRRESERLMREGKVKVNGNVHRNPGDKIRTDSSILIVGEEDLVRPSILLHKPVGVVSTQPDRRLKQVPAWELLTEENHDPGARDSSVVAREVTSEPWHMAVAGRLDKDSRGLLLMTQDGVLAKRVIGTKDVWKRYVVTVDEEPSKEQIRKLNTPMTLDGVRLKPMRVALSAPEARSPRVLEFELRDGRKHQIRRCCSKVGLRVVDLFRTQIGPWKIADLEEGKWRLLAREEIDLLRGQ